MRIRITIFFQLLLCTPLVSAAFLVEVFEDFSDSSVEISALSPGLIQESGIAGTGTLGELRREVDLNLLSAPTGESAFLTVSNFPEVERFFLISDIGGVVEANLRYSPVSGFFDLTSNGGNGIGMEHELAFTSVNVLISLTDVGGNSASLAKDLGVGETNFSNRFHQFAGTDALQLDKVTSVNFRFRSWDTGLDLSIGQIGLVPEPSVAVLSVVAAIFVFGQRVRRRRKNGLSKHR